MGFPRISSNVEHHFLNRRMALATFLNTCTMTQEQLVHDLEEAVHQEMQHLQSGVSVLIDRMHQVHLVSCTKRAASPRTRRRGGRGMSIEGPHLDAMEL